MRKIILNLAVSPDGYIEGPNGEYDWCFTDQDFRFCWVAGSCFLETFQTVYRYNLRTLKPTTVGWSR